MSEKINLLVKDGEKTIIEMRKGEALPLREPEKLAIAGNIDTVLRFLEKRIALIEQKSAHIVVNRETLSICLYVDETSYYSSGILGNAELDPKFKKFEINTGKSWTTFELADFIRMNRAFFEKPDEAISLVTDLRSFKAKVNKEIENSDDKRGNRDIVRRQVVESNIPANFKISVPLFKGFEKRTIEVEIDIDADTLNCRLVSPHAAELIANETDAIVDDQLRAINLIAPEIVVIET